MDSATPFDVSGGSGEPRSKLQTTLSLFSKRWPYICFAILLSLLDIALGIWTMSYLHFKQEPLMFGIVCFGAILALAQFASLCYLIQRAKDENSDPLMVDVAYAFGVTLLFSISGIALTIELPSKCFAGRNSDFLHIGSHWCNVITTTAVSSWLAVITMTIATVLTFVAARKAIELANMPPPVFPDQANTPVMRWLNRNDPFASYNRQYP